MLTVNITTTKSRLNLCSSTIWSLVNQELSPDVINLWVSKDKYLADEGIDFLPEWINKINNVKDILRVRYVENTGPYRKLFPKLLSSNYDETIVYADDDVIYRDSWLKTLIQEFNKHEGRFVVASRVRVVESNIFGIRKSYNMLKLVLGNKLLSTGYIITGVGGCVLSPSHIKKEFLHNKDYLKIAPKADDLWISKLLELSGSKVQVCPEALIHVNEINHDMDSLNSFNNVSLDGNLFMKIYKRIKMKVLGYLGVPLSNNDKIIRKVNNYFSSKGL